MGTALELREPWLLLTALLSVPLFLVARRAPGRVLFSSLGLLARAGPSRSVRARLAFVPALLLALAVGALGVALAGPRVGDRTTRIQRKGIAIFMVVDVSGSMAALDLSVEGEERTRLDAVKTVFHEFVAGDPDGKRAGRPDDVVGLVTFARYADCRCPLTLDHRSLLAIAGDLDLVTDRAEDGTAVGDGLGLALERLREAKAVSKVAILLTDGVQNAGELSPEKAGDLARSLGVKVYTVGAGTEGVAPVRVVDPFTGKKVLRPMAVEIDEASLRAIADATGGRYFRATDADGLARAYDEIDRLERTDVAEVRYLQYVEHFEAFVAAGLGLAWLGLLLGATVLRRLP